ncbi:MAG: relaxase/mobilization nuclease domain-containing protein [Prevotella sp.]|nr:relaxase/mobilization nuclease domain-containing protein [Prevotella sp.]
MSILKIVSGDYTNGDAVQKLFNYITDYEKSEGLVYGYNVIPELAVQMFMTVKSLYGKMKGKQAVHFIISFPPDETITAEALFELSKCVSRYFYGYQVVFAVHTSQKCLHVHFMVNTISFIDGKRLDCTVEFKESFLTYCKEISYTNMQSCV